LTDPQYVQVKTVELKSGATVEDAVVSSGLLDLCKDVDAVGYGIWGQSVATTQLLHEGDRIEIYRPLVLTPKERRLLVVKKKKSRLTKRYTPWIPPSERKE
jgi:putative ubiquitin-RnfH superfamily antitoxin RatB of RatAB toxin-antitoxin module